MATTNIFDIVDNGSVQPDAHSWYDRTEISFEQRLAADPQDADTLGDYAMFLEAVRADADRARELYERAIQMAPEHAKNLRSFAIFLHCRGDYDQAEEMYQRSIAADPHHAPTLANYAIFLAKVRQDPDRSDAMFRQAVRAAPAHADLLTQYAIFLETARRDADRAERMYHRAMQAAPNDASTLTHYAIFLESERHDVKRATETFEQAVHLAPEEVGVLANYASFLTQVRDHYKRSEQAYHQAFSPNSPLPPSSPSLEMSIVHGNLARLLFAMGQDAEATEAAMICLSGITDPTDPLRAEVSFYLFAHSPEHRAAAGAQLRQLLADGITTGSWSFEPNRERLRREGDPRLALLTEVAAALRTGDTSALDARGRWYCQ